jgi:hypothetical protein
MPTLFMPVGRILSTNNMFKRTSSFSPPYIGEGPQTSSSPLSVTSRILIDVALLVVVLSTCIVGIGHRWYTWGWLFSDPHTRYASYLRCFMLNQGIWMWRFVMRCTPISTYLLDTGHRWWTWESLCIDPHTSYASYFGCLMLIKCVDVLSQWIWM